MGIFKWFCGLFKKDKDVLQVDCSDITTQYPNATRRAIIVGINKYQIPGSNLNGCVNDAKDIYCLLTEQFGFKPENVVLLFDERATTQNIINTLIEKIANTQPGDELVYYHSGHGTQIPDINSDEDDGMAECLVSYDFDWNNPETHLLDKRFAKTFKPLVECAYLSVIADACHSQTATKVFHNPHNCQRKIRHLINPGLPEHFASKHINHVGRKDVNLDTQRHVMMSGCKDDEVSEELMIGNAVRGVLTFNLTKTLRTNKNMNWLSLHCAVAKAIKTVGFPQNPQLSGMLSLKKRCVFGGKK